MSEIIRSGKELAKILGVSQNTICNYLKRGMPYIKLANGRRGYRLEDIEKWLIGEDKY